MDLMQKQLELEELMSSAGLTRLQRKIEQERKRQRGHTTPSGKMLMDAVLEPSTKALEDWLKKAGTQRGKKHLSYQYLLRINPEIAMFIAAKLAIDAVMSQDRLLTLCRKIGDHIEAEVKYSDFVENGTTNEGNPVKAYYDELQRGLKKRRMRGYRQITHELDRAMELHEIEWEDWPSSDKVRIGEKLLSILAASTELIQTTTVTKYGKSKILLRPGAGLEDLIEQYDIRYGLLHPVWMPCIVPPKPWTTPFDGGYHGRKLRRLTLVKVVGAKSYLEDLKSVDMPKVYESINRLQNTGWSVNRPVLEVVQALREAGYGVAGLPVRENIEIPPYPEQDLPNHEELALAWRQRARQIHEFNALNLSQRLATERTVAVAEEYEPYDAFYFPMQLDFRGRVYPVSSDLQPQGSDLSRGLLQFSEAKAINTPEQARWLAVHLANCFGVDKVSMEERVRWVEEHFEAILEVATDPLDFKWWHEADKPFQFLAACFDWAGLMSDGYGYESRLPIQMDGTCNGLQIFSLLLRDEVGGAGVNLVPSDQPQDIYQRVADEVVKDVRRVLEESPASEEGEWAERWLQLGIDRKLCKRPVMTLPYGVTEFSVRSFVYDVVKERHGNQTMSTIFGDDKATRSASNWMGALIWAGIGRVVVAAADAMEWLRKLAAEAGKNKVAISWMTPSGLPARQHYRKQKTRRLTLKIGETWLKAHYNEPTAVLDNKRQINGIAPNYVHSLDGAALTLTVCLAAQYGVSSFSMVHDSYGTHAADAQKLADSLREVFVDIFDGKDLLQSLEQDVIRSCPTAVMDIPPRPGFGNLDVRAVLDSEYFFA